MTSTSMRTWSVKESSSWGLQDPDIWRPYSLAKDLVKHLDASEDVIDRADFASDRIKDELETALVHYQVIMGENFSRFNLSRQRAAYESLYSDLWTLYKDRMQAYLSAMGISIRFIFAEDNKNFRKYANIFIQDNPESADFVVFAKQQRDGWQNDLAKNRNAHEHHGDLRNGVKDFDNPQDAKRIFAQVCWTMETTMASLVSWKLQRTYNVIDTAPKSTVFDRHERIVIEHALMTQQREKKEQKK